jgi:protoporphyrinogen oxidase
MFEKSSLLDPYEDLSSLKEKFAKTSVWRFKSGMQTFSDTLVKHLQKFDDIELKDNEKCLEIDMNNKSNRVGVKTSKNVYDFDYVISSVYSKRK